MNPPVVKTSGYLISTASVLLLGAVAWKGASDNPALLACLILGMTTSMLGMFLRWLSYEAEKKAKALKAPPASPT